MEMKRDSMLEELMRPEAYPPPAPASVQLVTTHISWVFLTDGDAWKVKRPVDYGFVDYTSLDRRRHFCHEEVRLNRRLAPDVYLGVVPVRKGPSGCSFDARGPIVDYAVRMRRLPDEASAWALLERGALTTTHLDRLAALLAGFYLRQPATPAAGAVEQLRANAVANFDEVRGFIPRFVDAATFEAVGAWQMRRLEDRARFHRRIERRQIRDGHGDLRLEHVYFEGSDPIVIDCVEFSDRFRMGDVASDAGFLAMELLSRGRRDLADRFLARFAAEMQDFDLYEVVDYYLSYRAWVRGKVACLLAADPATPEPKAQRKAEEARNFFNLAREVTRPAGAGPILAVGGLIGTGKSTLADALSRRSGFPIVASDRTRKWLAGLDPSERGPDRIYDATFSRHTFDEVFRRAEVVARSGRGVILDATFRSEELRRRARDLAAKLGRPFLFVETTCDDATIRERLRRRAEGPSVSDATEPMLDRFRREFEPVEFPEHVRVDTARPIEDQLECVGAALKKT